MADYALTANEHTILRTADQAFIPDDPANRDYQEYLAWQAAGGVPEPYAAPPAPAPEPTITDLLKEIAQLKAKLGV